LAEEFSDRFRVVDGARAIDDVAQDVADVVTQHLAAQSPTRAPQMQG
jgi:dTMP kinase